MLLKFLKKEWLSSLKNIPFLFIPWVSESEILRIMTIIICTRTHINKFQMLQICQKIKHLAWPLRFHPHSNPFSQLKLFKIAGMSHWCLDIIIRNLTSNFSPGFQKMLSNSSPEPKIGVTYKKCVFIFIFDCLQVLNFLHSVFIGIVILMLV